MNDADNPPMHPPKAQNKNHKKVYFSINYPAKYAAELFMMSPA